MPTDTLAGMAAAPGLIGEAVRAAPPAGREGWSPAEIAAHLADIEVGFGWRLRRIISEDVPALHPFDQEVWAAALRYGEREANVSLEAYAAQRAVNVEIMGRLSEGDWERRFAHPEFGGLTLRDLVEHISDHDLAHLKQIGGAE